MVKGYYDPSDYSSFIGLLNLIFSFNGMPKLVLKLAAFWLLLLFQLGLLSTRYLYAEGIWHVPLPTVEWASIKSVTSLLTFFIVFYGGSMYGRYQTFYGHCVGLGGDCMNWVCLVRNHCPQDKAVRWNCTRFVLSCVHVLYFSLNEPAPGEPDIGEEEWDIMRERHLFTMAEIATLKEYKGYKPFLPLVWALEEVEKAMKTDYPNAPRGPELATIIATFRGLAFEMRGHCGQVRPLPDGRRGQARDSPAGGCAPRRLRSRAVALEALPHPPRPGLTPTCRGAPSSRSDHQLAQAAGPVPLFPIPHAPLDGRPDTDCLRLDQHGVSLGAHLRHLSRDPLVLHG